MLVQTRTITLKSLLAFAVVLLLFSMGCERQRLKVIHMPGPDYPIQASSQGMQGVVVVTVGIGTDGKVNYAVGKGANSLFVQAAQKNAKDWIFEVPAHARFPLEHQIKYTFKFDNEPTAVNLMPTIVTDLPDAVEIIATRTRGDNVILIPPEPSKKSPNSR